MTSTMTKKQLTDLMTSGTWHHASRGFVTSFDCEREQADGALVKHTVGSVAVQSTPDPRSFSVAGIAYPVQMRVVFYVGYSYDEGDKESLTHSFCGAAVEGVEIADADASFLMCLAVDSAFYDVDWTELDI